MSSFLICRDQRAHAVASLLMIWQFPQLANIACSAQMSALYLEKNLHPSGVNKAFQSSCKMDISFPEGTQSLPFLARRTSAQSFMTWKLIGLSWYLRGCHSLSRRVKEKMSKTRGALLVTNDKTSPQRVWMCTWRFSFYEVEHFYRIKYKHAAFQIKMDNQQSCSAFRI